MSSSKPLCPVCGGKGKAKDKVEGFSVCDGCSHIWQTNLTPTIDYNKPYIEHYDALESREAMSFLRAGFVRCLRMRAGKRRNIGTRLLDVGYGNGDFLKAAQKCGFEIYGSDVHGLGEKYGIRDIPLDTPGSWEIVTFFDSLEHFASLDIIRGLLCRTKMAVVSLPCLSDALLVAGEWKHHKPGEHIHLFTLQSLKILMNQAGLQLIDACDIEDAVRGKLGGKTQQQNILTDAFSRG